MERMKGEADNKTTPHATAERIVQGARACFARYGIQKTTIEDIASAAGVSRPTVYKHFPGKQHIIDHISLTEMARVHADLRTRMTRKSSFADTITEAILLSVQAAHANPYVRRFVQDPELASRSHIPSSPFQIGARERWSALLARAEASGELATDIGTEEIVAWLSLSQMMLLTTIEQLGTDEERMRRFIRRFVVEPLLAARGQ